MSHRRIAGTSLVILIAALGLLLLSACGGGGGDGDKPLTKADLFTRMIGFYETSTQTYKNGELTYDGSSCGYVLEMYDTWWYLFDDMNNDTKRPGFLNSSLNYTSNSVRYELSWEEVPGVVCTEFEGYVFGAQGATYTYETEEICDGETWRQEVSGTRLGAVDTPNDVIGEAIPIAFDTPLSVSLDEGDLDFFTFTLTESTSTTFLFENFTGSLSGLNHALYSGEGQWIPDGGFSSGTVPSPDRSWSTSDLDARTYYLILSPSDCGESGTFDLTLKNSDI